MEPLSSQLAIKIGTDLVHMLRYEKFVDDAVFLNRILTDGERKIYDSLTHERRKLEFICGRYAAKEAYAKALGTGIGVTDFKDVEILRSETGQPLCDKAQVSISHDGDYAIAMVCVYE